jgi:Flagellar hook capping protein
MSAYDNSVNSYNSAEKTSSTSSSKTSSIFNVNNDMFLKILAAELQNQDPSNTKDSTEYVAQMAQFAALEQMQSLSTSMEQLMAGQRLQEGSMMIGKAAKVAMDDGTYVNGVVTGARFGGGVTTVLIDGKEYDIDRVVELSEGQGSEANAL